MQSYFQQRLVQECNPAQVRLPSLQDAIPGFSEKSSNRDTSFHLQARNQMSFRLITAKIFVDGFMLPVPLRVEGTHSSDHIQDINELVTELLRKTLGANLFDRAITSEAPQQIDYSFEQNLVQKCQEKSQSSRHLEEDDLKDEEMKTTAEHTIKRIKKDALWKPLLRGFRTFIRNMFQSRVDLVNFFNVEGEINPQVLVAVNEFFKELGLPEEVANNERHMFAIIVTLAPTSAGNLLHFFRTSEKMKPYLTELKQIFCTVFRENSVFLRRRFFSDELVQHVWKHFAQSEKAFINQYFSELKTISLGEGKSQQVLLSDIVQLSNHVGFDILNGLHQ